MKTRLLLSLLVMTALSLHAQRQWTLDDCINDAIAECRDWIQTELLETLDMPPVSDYDDIPVKENEHIRTIGVIVRLYEGWDE